MLIFDDYEKDVRIDKELKTLNKVGISTKIMSFGNKESKDTINITINRKSKLFRAFEFTRKAYKKIKNTNVKVIHSHDFMALPIGFILSRLLKTKFIFDAHELYHVLHGGSAIKEKILKWLIPKTDCLITVSNSIERVYKEEFNAQNTLVLRNTPDFKSVKDKQNLLREELQISSDKKILLFQGYLVPDREIGNLIHLLPYLPNDYILVLMGEIDEQYKENLITLSNNLKVFERLYIKQPVLYDEITNYTSGADLGIVIFENKNLNYYYCLPNKLFEYIVSKVPVIVSDFPDMRELVLSNNYGITVKEDEKFEEIAHKIVNMLEKDEYTLYLKNLQKSSDQYRWEFEQKKLVALYNKLLKEI